MNNKVGELCVINGITWNNLHKWNTTLPAYGPAIRLLPRIQRLFCASVRLFYTYTGAISRL